MVAIIRLTAPEGLRSSSAMEKPLLNRVLIGAGVALALAGGGLYWWQHRAPPPAPEAPPEAAAPAPADDADPAIEHPLPPAPADGAAALPAVGDSDAPLGEELARVFGAAPLAAWLEPQNLVRRLVATVDGLPRAHGADRLRPLKPVDPPFAVDRQAPSSITAEERISLAPGNAARYEPYVALLEKTDLKLVVRVYQRWYPLLQQSYEELGYPGRYFNDRLVTVINHLLETPRVKGTLELVQPNVMFEFADPQLEALSSGQKLLLRMGPENAARVQAKLKELHALITQPGAVVPAAAAAPAASK
jgi:hypothetical protein